MRVQHVGALESSKLTRDKIYEVIGIEGNYFRILNDMLDPCLYEPCLFNVVDPSEPEFWITVFGKEQERYSYPISWSKAGFFEDYHDGIRSAVDCFWREYERLYPKSL